MSCATYNGPRVPAAGSAGELLSMLQSRGLREAFPVAVSARVRSIADLQAAIRNGSPVINEMANATGIDSRDFSLRILPDLRGTPPRTASSSQLGSGTRRSPEDLFPTRPSKRPRGMQPALAAA
eukprot:1699594-Amphidinium_carterae.1